MPTVHLHTLNYDNAHAPNPYFGVCTLATCALHVRRVAQPGDLVIGLGAKNYHVVDERNPSTTIKKDIGFRGKVVYCMVVEKRLTWPQYIQHCEAHAPGKIPDMDGSYGQRAGDCQYRLVKQGAGYTIEQRLGLHSPGQAANDLKAGVLIGGEFFYAGARASAAPAWLAALQAKGREPVTLKGEHAARARDWFEGEPRGMLGEPMLRKLVHY